MSESIIESEVFENVDFTIKALTKGKYDCCKFINCTFNNSDISNINFVESVFENCDLSSVSVKTTAFKEVQFINCHLVGINFSVCNPFLLSMEFTQCELDLVSFFRLQLKSTSFRTCSLKKTEFTEADLTQAVFDDCNLERAIFEDTILAKANLSTSYNYSIDPEKNNIKKAKFSQLGLAGLLSKYDIQIE